MNAASRDYVGYGLAGGNLALDRVKKTDELPVAMRRMLSSGTPFPRSPVPLARIQHSDEHPTYPAARREVVAWCIHSQQQSTM